MGNVFYVLEDNRIILNDGIKVAEPYYWQTTYITDFLGKVYQQYDTHAIHHDMIELPNGNLLYAAEHPQRDTTEDYIIELDRNTGEVVNTWDLLEILEMEEYIATDAVIANHFEDDRTKAQSDWLHMNAIYYDETTNALVISARHQDLAMSIDYTTKEINWIFANPENELFATSMDKYMLTAVGDDFEYVYGPHGAMIGEQGDLLIFDNGNNRVVDSTQNYSRIVQYQIDDENMTIEQVYQYGKERGSELFSMYMSDVDELAPGHLLASFSGIVRNSDGTATDDMMILLEDGIAVTKIIELLDGEVISEVEIDINAYRAQRITLY
ncbi:MAG: hypothetical protein ATN34_04905 [Epulopiscium sp. Nele67-Bin002]|nr:MAG: hypothetical protein ATN34_04905 [Epulopiscium sp. Nele67-Bin002]